jgi:hypothetical protein
LLGKSALFPRKKQEIFRGFAPAIRQASEKLPAGGKIPVQSLANPKKN